MTEILVSRRQALEDLAELLLEKEMIERRQVQATLNKRSLEVTRREEKGSQMI